MWEAEEVEVWLLRQKESECGICPSPLGKVSAKPDLINLTETLIVHMTLSP